MVHVSPTCASRWTELEKGALGLLVVSRKLADARVGQSKAKVPAALLEQATAQRKRMSKAADQRFEGHRWLEEFMIDVRRGRSILEMADDLARLSGVFVTEAKRQETNRWYRADDATVAARLSGEIGRALIAGLPPAAQALRSIQLKLYAIADRAWRHVARALALILADEPELLPPTLRAQVLAVMDAQVLAVMDRG